MPTTKLQTRAGPDSPGRLLRVKEAAERLSVSRSTAYALMDQNQLPYHKLGSRRRVSEADLAAYLARSRIGGP